MGALASIGSKLNLSKQQEMYKAPFRTPEFMEVVSGSVNEFMGAPVDKETHTELENHIMVAGGQIAELGASPDGYDRVRFQFGEIPKPATSYKGMSGGGIWRIELRGDEVAGYSAEERRLMGVAFFETEERHIIGHGRLSIYEKLLPEIVKWI
jgi:hypothetical protein